MKKRLLSAALALAMVLTLLPVSAFAATPTRGGASLSASSGTAMTAAQEGVTVTWYQTEHTFGKDNAGNDVKSTTPGYYWWDSNARVLYHAENGVIEGTSATGGRWHANPYAPGTTVTILNSFTLLADHSSLGQYDAFATSSISVNLNGFNLTLNVNETNGTKLTNLTVTNSPADSTVPTTPRPAGTLTLGSYPNFSNLSDRSITLNVTNATVSGTIQVTSAANAAYGITATLNNAVVGNLKVIGNDTYKGTLSVTMSNDSTVGTLDTENAPLRLDARTGSTVGAVTCKGAKADIDATGAFGKRVTIDSITLGDSTAGTGWPAGAKDNKSGGTIDLTSAASVTGAITVYGQTTINVKDTSSVGGDISFLGGTATDGPNNGLPNWQGVTINVSGYQTNIKSILQMAGDTLLATVRVEDTATAGHIDLGQYGGTVTVSHATTMNINVGKGPERGDALTVNNGAAVSGNIDLGGKGAAAATISGSDTTVTGYIRPANKSTTLTINDGKFNYAGTGAAGGQTTMKDDLEVGATTVKGGTFKCHLLRSPVLSNIAYEFGTDIAGAPSYDAQTFTYVPSGAVNDVFKTLVDMTQAAGGVDKTIIKPANFTTANGYTIVYFQLDHDQTGGQLNTPVSILRMYAATNSWIDLPSQAGGRNVTNWYKGEAPYQTNYIVSAADAAAYDPADLPSSAVKLVADSTAASTTDITAVSLDQDNPVLDAVNKGLTVGLDSSRKVIKLSGLITLVGNQATIPVDLVNSRGSKVFSAAILVDRANNQTRLAFSSADPGLTIRGDNKILAVNNSTQEFTLDGSGLTIRDVNLPVSVAGSSGGTTSNITAGDTKATVSGGIGGTAGRDSYKARLEAASKFTDSTLVSSEAVQQALNNVLKGITKSQVDSWLATARRAIATELKDTNSSKYADTYAEWGSVEIEPYLDIQVTNWTNKTGSQSSASLNVNLTLKYRVVAVNSGKATAPWTALANKYPGAANTENGKKLASFERYEVTTGTLNLTGNYGDITLTLALPDNFAPTGTQLYAHHGNYAYQTNVVADPAATSNMRQVTFTTSHGFSPFTLNEDTPVAKVDTIIKNGVTAGTADDFKYLYDNLNTAVAEVADKGTIKLYPGFATGTTNVPVSGKARMFKVVTDANSQTKLNFTGSNTKFTGDEANGNMTYTVTLSSDTAVPTEKPVAITVATAANGAATSSAARADYGETVTITVRPNAGYGLSTLTIRTNTGANVAYQSTTTNVFTFKVPENVTSITVTPAFAVSSTATISVTDTVNGLATTNAANNKAAGGSTVTVTTRPFNGYRTNTVTAVTNTGAAVAVTRVAENTYTFVVPIAATSVVITPTFTASGHPFTDVPDGQWYSDAVSFGWRHGMFTGYNGSTTRFAGTERLTRAELVVILYRLSGEPATTDNSGFSDVGSGIWYSKAITWATRNNIVRGGDNNRFYPLNNVTREELAQMLYNYNSYRRGSTGLTGNLSRFTDANRVHAYHLTAMQWAVGNGIVQGNNNSQLNPGGTATRYEVATMLMRYGQSFMGLT